MDWAWLLARGQLPGDKNQGHALQAQVEERERYEWGLLKGTPHALMYHGVSTYDQVVVRSRQSVESVMVVPSVL